MLVIKSFVSLKEWVFAIFDEGTSQGGSEVLKFSSFAFFGVEGGKKGDVHISGWGWYPREQYDGFFESDLWKC